MMTPTNSGEYCLLTYQSDINFFLIISRVAFLFSGGVKPSNLSIVLFGADAGKAMLTHKIGW